MQEKQPVTINIQSVIGQVHYIVLNDLSVQALRENPCLQSDLQAALETLTRSVAMLGTENNNAGNNQ